MDPMAQARHEIYMLADELYEGRIPKEVLAATCPQPKVLDTAPDPCFAKDVQDAMNRLYRNNLSALAKKGWTTRRRSLGLAAKKKAVG